MTDGAIRFCLDVYDGYSTVDQCCIIIEEFADGDTVNASKINDELAALALLQKQLERLSQHLQAIRDGLMTPKEARGLK